MAALTAYVTGRRPQRPGVQFIPAERYYLWESLVMTPVTFGWMTLFASFVRGGSRRVVGRGTYRPDVTMLAVGHPRR